MATIQRRTDFSGGLQTATSWLLRQPNEVAGVINGRFNAYIGAVVRRLGYIKQGSVMTAAKPSFELHEAKFSTGAVMMSAHNNSGDTATVIDTFNGTTWAALSLPASLPANTKVQLTDSLGETYVSGRVPSGARISLVNIKNDLTTSATRNILNAPKAAGLVEFGGNLYAINVEVNGTVYSDRAYQSSQAMGVITYAQGVQTSVTSLKVDSVEWLKVGMSIDVYTAGTETKISTVTISAVSKSTNTVTISSAITVADNDEIWLTGRKNELCYLWNTDYPTPDQAPFLRIPPSVSSDSEITAWAKNNNRLFLFTKSSTYKWDGANLVAVFEDVGCPNIDTIQNIGGWLIWVDNEGQVRAHNDSSGQDEIISRGIRNNYLEKVPLSNFSTATSGKIKNTYKLCVGTINGEIWRFCYDFDSNNWAYEIHGSLMTQHITSDRSGYMRMYFADDKGQLYLDEEGNLDDTLTIPFLLRLGRSNDGTDFTKDFQGVYIYGDNTAGAAFKAFFDGGDPVSVGQLAGKISKLAFNRNLPHMGRDSDFEITLNANADPISIEGISLYYEAKEDRFV